MVGTSETSTAQEGESTPIPWKPKMPGILPMKVIKVGTSSQARIAQACDRCRSKKIRCDGIRPSCTQCVNVGFECKTSDKLSRRAFPRGYTESLEERVRSLEAEVRELKDLLDEKDEKIDMLSRIRSNTPHVLPMSSRTSSISSPPLDGSEPTPQDREDFFKVLQSPVLLEDENGESIFMGTSSGRALIDSFKHKMLDTGQPCDDLEPMDFLTRNLKPLPTIHKSNANSLHKAPPRLVSDQLVNIYFQEWAPLFPAFHRPTFLALYDNFVSNPEKVNDSASLAQLNLVFCIAALSSKTYNENELDTYESYWRPALAFLLTQNSLVTLQCLALAQIYCLLKADHACLLKYKGLAISLAHRLGLHQSQKRFSLGVLTCETRKKVFWTLYTVDCLSAAQLGLPRLIKEEDVNCEYPVDADDEYITEQGFLPTLPGESTKLSSALALFRAMRILSKVLFDLYPTAASHEISLKTISGLGDELDSWSHNLAPHLQLQFSQDKPSTNVTGNRSPILSMTYHYIRSLIHRPAVCALPSLGDRASSSIVALASSSKHLIQIIQLLEERNLSFSFSLNKNEVITLAGFGILFQAMDLDSEGKLIKDSRKLFKEIFDLLERGRASSALAFKRLTISTLPQRTEQKRVTLSRHNSDGCMPAPQRSLKTTHEQLKAIAAKFSIPTDSPKQDELVQRRGTVPNLHGAFGSLGQHPNKSHTAVSSTAAETKVTRSEPALSPLMRRELLIRPESTRTMNNSTKQVPNLDFMSFNQSALAASVAARPAATKPVVDDPSKGEHTVSSAEWERLLGSLDNGQTNIYDNIYGGLPAEALADINPLPTEVPWNTDSWGLAQSEALNASQAPVPQSVLSFSDESLTSGEEWVSVNGSGTLDSYPGILITESGLEGLDGGFGL